MPDRAAKADAGSYCICIRPAIGADAPAMLTLIRSHATYEGGQASVTEAALRSALDGPPPVLTAWVATEADVLVGYASVTVDFATWAGRSFLHLDCLFVADHCRGLGVGAKLLAAVRAHAATHDLEEIQWQTPTWNDDAIRFYRREGATSLTKVRFTLVTR